MSRNHNCTEQRAAHPKNSLLSHREEKAQKFDTSENKRSLDFSRITFFSLFQPALAWIITKTEYLCQPYLLSFACLIKKIFLRFSLRDLKLLGSIWMEENKQESVLSKSLQGQNTLIGTKIVGKYNVKSFVFNA